MTFRQAVDQTPSLAGAFRKGLQALRAKDGSHIRVDCPRHLKGSVDIDAALRPAHPNANRWDYGIGYQHGGQGGETIYWVETHTGSDEEIKVVLRKLVWLHAWLENDGQKLDRFARRFYWVPSGATEFTQGSQQVKQLSQKGIVYSGSVLRIRD